MRVLTFCAFVAMTAPAYTQTVPSAPSITAGPEQKGLRFDWEPVADATRYELEYKANADSVFAQIGNDYPGSATSARFRLPLHLFDWTNARYRVAACNSAGCTRSNEVSVSELRRDAVVYVKASDSEPELQFGDEVDVTPDGLNFVVSAPHNSGQYLAEDSDGAAYVFGRRRDGTWFQRAKLSIPEPNVGALYGRAMRVSISADGNTVAVSVPSFEHSEFDSNRGEVYVFRFNGTTWARARLYTGYRSGFGSVLELNDAGDTLLTEDLFDRWLVYKLQDGAWNPVRMIQNPRGRFCSHPIFSGDGSVIAQHCGTRVTNNMNDVYLRTHSGSNWTTVHDVLIAASFPSTHFRTGFAIDDSGDTIALGSGRSYSTHPEDWPPPTTGDGKVTVFKRSSGVYTKVADLFPGVWRSDPYKGAFGFQIALSGDGNTLAIGDPLDNGLGAGPQSPPLAAGTVNTGAVYVYRFRDTWRLMSVMKPNYPDTRVSPYLKSFGADVDLNGNGHTLLVTDDAESSDATGVGGDGSNQGAVRSGAVWIY